MANELREKFKEDLFAELSDYFWDDDRPADIRINDIEEMTVNIDGEDTKVEDLLNVTIYKSAFTSEDDVSVNPLTITSIAGSIGFEWYAKWDELPDDIFTAPDAAAQVAHLIAITFGNRTVKNVFTRKGGREYLTWVGGQVIRRALLNPEASHE